MKNRLSFLITYYVYVNWIDDWFEWRNKMQKEAIHQLIVKLTLNKNWLNDPMIVNEVKYLGDQLSCTRRSPINYIRFRESMFIIWMVLKKCILL